MNKERIVKYGCLTGLAATTLSCCLLPVATGVNFSFSGLGNRAFGLADRKAGNAEDSLQVNGYDSQYRTGPGIELGHKDPNGSRLCVLQIGPKLTGDVLPADLPVSLVCQ